jgi:hypothetical protein
MKAKLIIVNWLLSFMGLTVVSPFLAAMCGFGWFIVSCVLLNYADRKGYMKEFRKSRVGKF